MVTSNVTVTAATEFNANEENALLTLTFTNSEAFTPASGTNYYYTATLTETVNAVEQVEEYTFKMQGSGSEIGATHSESFVVENTHLFTSAAVISLEKIYYTAA